MAAVTLALSLTPPRTPDSVLFRDSRFVVQRVILISSRPHSGFSALRFSEKTPQMCTVLFRTPHVSTLPTDTSLLAFFSDGGDSEIYPLCLANLLRAPIVPMVMKPQQLPHCQAPFQGSDKGRIPLDLEFLLLLLQMSATSGLLRAL